MKDYTNLITEVLSSSKKINSGKLASYIPELANVNPDLVAISITLVNGETFSVGDTTSSFTLQSTSKPFAYGLALEDLGVDYVHSKVGVEPSGEAFNSIIELEKKTHRPFNPMINSGAIAIANMIQDKNGVQRQKRILNLFSDLAGRDLDFNQSVFLSEKKTAHRNRAIAHLLRHFEVIGDDIEESLDLYFNQCSINVNVTDLSLMAATLANNGIQPKTKKKIYSENNIHKILSLMFSCGMYDTAGTWAFNVGIPSKSGVSGAIFGVIPNQLAIACYSPLIDEHGHSEKGVFAITEIAKKLNLNIFQSKI